LARCERLIGRRGINGFITRFTTSVTGLATSFAGVFAALCVSATDLAFLVSDFAINFLVGFIFIFDFDVNFFATFVLTFDFTAIAHILY
jgi:hypothetical protein